MLTLIQDLYGKKFIIPAYQRGYRWTVDENGHGEIADLLQDIKEFNEGTATAPKQYCIQPLIVKKVSVDGIEKHEVIDGQQRLTTIFLILNFIHKSTKETKEAFEKLGQQSPFEVTDKSPYKLEYETRVGSAIYLENPSDADKNKNIDYFHIYNASKQIKKFFTDNAKIKRDDFANKILNYVGFIYYEIPSNANVIDTFAKENTGKIPLTSAELVKAILFSKENFNRRQLPSGRLEDYNVLEDRIYKEQTQMTLLWDTIEQSLEISEFWGFISNNNNYATKIDLLFEIIARRYNNGAFQNTQNYFSFLVLGKQIIDASDKEKRVQDLWRELESIYSILKACYENFENYHILGSAVACGISIDEIVNIILSNSKTKAKREIFSKVKQLICAQKNRENDIDYQSRAKQEIKDLEYGSDNAKIRKNLLLFNTTTILQMLKSNAQNTSYRFPFNLYKFSPWNIEHIHAIKDTLSSKDQEENTKYCESIINYIEKNKTTANEKESNNAIAMINKNKSNTPKSNQWWEGFKRSYADLLGARDNDNYIRNLALLDESTNKSYQNDPFSLKKEVIRKCVEKGIFVPICTQNVFLKLYSDGASDLYRWTNDDRINYENKIADTIVDYWFN